MNSQLRMFDNRKGSAFDDDFLTIYHADDDEDDKELVVAILKELNVSCKLISVADGEQLLDLLYHDGGYSFSKSRPDVIILDINMPKANGFEVLQKIKNDELHSELPVYMLSTSFSKYDIKVCTHLGSSGCFQKTYDYFNWKKSIEQICSGAILAKKVFSQKS